MALTIGALVAAMVVFESTAHGAITGLERVASGLSAPMFATFAPGDSTHLFIGQRDGTIRVMNLRNGIMANTPFLTIPGINQDGEGGLLGMAFDPNYRTNGKFYVNATFPNSSASSGMATEIRQYSVSTTSSIIANPTPTPIISWLHPQTNHKAGWIGFNPQAAPGQTQYLYIPTGDGGSGYDNDGGHTAGTGNAQDITDNPLGKILRIDVSGDDFPSDGTRNYKIPPTNPYVGVSGDDEIFAIGMRNPFRDSFDRATGDLWLGDVGQDTREEIDKLVPPTNPNVTQPAKNLGWRLREGTVQTPTVGGAEPPNYLGPVFDYGRTGTVSGATVIGGYVYRGPDPQLQGKYFFSDTGDKYWTFDPANPTGTVTSIKSMLTPNTGTASFPVSYAEDADGNLYIVYLNSGDVYRIDTDFLLPGDFNRDRQLTAADIPAMLNALTNLQAFEATNGLSDLSLDLIGDLNHDGRVTNADIQSLLSLIASGGGGALDSVPEPATWLLSCLAAPIALASPRIRRRLGFGQRCD